MNYHLQVMHFMTPSVTSALQIAGRCQREDATGSRKVSRDRKCSHSQYITCYHGVLSGHGCRRNTLFFLSQERLYLFGKCVTNLYVSSNIQSSFSGDIFALILQIAVDTRLYAAIWRLLLPSLSGFILLKM